MNGSIAGYNTVGYFKMDNVIYDAEKYQTPSAAARELNLSRQRIHQLLEKGRVIGAVIAPSGRVLVPKPCVIAPAAHKRGPKGRA